MWFYIVVFLIVCAVFALVIVSACFSSGDAERQAERIEAFERAFKK